MMIKKLWHDPVWSKVIAGSILTGCAVIGSYLLNWWPIIGRSMKEIFDFAFLSTELPNWLIGLLILLALPAIIIAIALIWERVKPKPSGIDKGWQSYKSDVFYNLRWRWKYSGDGKIYDLCTFCLNCDFQVFPHNTSVPFG